MYTARMTNFLFQVGGSFLSTLHCTGSVGLALRSFRTDLSLLWMSLALLAYRISRNVFNYHPGLGIILILSVKVIRYGR